MMWGSKVVKEEINGQTYSAIDFDEATPKRRIAEETPRKYDKQLPTPVHINVIDFFCGCGGVSAGFLSTRQSHLAFRILGGVDIDEWALETYKKNIGARGVREDISRLASDPMRLAQLFPEIEEEAGRPLLFIGCPPCQGFSALRKGDDRDDARNRLIDHFVSLVLHFKPEYFVIENVPEVLSGKYAHYYRMALARLTRAGYDFTSQVVDLSAYGVPQRRKRAVLIGSLAGEVMLQAPPIATAARITVREAIGHLRPLSAGEVDTSDINHRAPAHTERLIRLFEKIPADGGDRRGVPRDMHIPAHQRLDDSSTPGFTDVYGRLRWDTPSVTITAKSRSPSSGRFLHPEQHRNITVREAALLQGFPPDYSFLGPPTQQYRQVGEAVPPLFSRFLAASVLDHARPLNPRSVPSIKWEKIDKSKPEHGGKPKLVDAFCGAGGLSLGFVNAGFFPVFAFDDDQDAIATYCQNFGDVGHKKSVLDSDIALRIDEAVCGDPFVLVGGPPCQGFSHQRKGSADDPRNDLVVKFGELVATLKTKPFAVVVENVTDLELPRGKVALAKLKKQMSRLGYVAFRHILNAADFGSPQLRRRVVLVFLASQFADKYAGPLASTPDRWLTVGDVLSDMPNRAEDSPELRNHQVANESAINSRRIAYVGMGGGRLSIPQELQLPCHAGDYRGHRDVYGRMDWFSLSRTITGGFDSYTRGEYAHPFRHRSVTHREGARLQGFPDWFEFVGNRNAVRRQIGNAVPPGMGYAIADAILGSVPREAKLWGS